MIDPQVLSKMRCWLAVAAVLGTSTSASAQTFDGPEFFEKKIRPVFASQCAGCHNAKQKMAGLDLSTLVGIVAVVQTGDITRKDNPDQSRLLKVIGYEEKLRMPPTGKLPAAVIADLKTWVSAGAPLPALPVMAATPAAPPKK